MLDILVSCFSARYLTVRRKAGEIDARYLATTYLLATVKSINAPLI